MQPHEYHVALTIFLIIAIIAWSGYLIIGNFGDEVPSCPAELVIAMVLTRSLWYMVELEDLKHAVSSF